MHWAEKRQSENVNGLMRRITPIRQLAKYMNRLGIDAYIIPPGILESKPGMFLISLRIRNFRRFLLKSINVQLVRIVLSGI